jgi:hypothetical protein
VVLARLAGIHRRHRHFHPDALEAAVATHLL